MSAHPSTPTLEATRAPPPAGQVAAAVLGNALEFYDFTVYAIFAVAIGKAFFPSGRPGLSLLLSVATFGVGFVARPLGGIVIGAYADRFGRKPAMTLTIGLMALGSGLIGVLPGYAAIGVAAPLLLVLARVIQGFSAGGEMGPATCYLVESARPKRRGLLGSWQFASQNMGQILGGLVGLVLAATFPAPAAEAWGWRVPFLLGILIAPVGVYIRRNLGETLDAGTAHASLGAVLQDLFAHHWRSVALAVLVISGGTVTQYFFLYNTTYALTSLGYGAGVAMASTLTLGLTGAAFGVAGGLAADRFGLKATALLPRIAVTLLLYPALLVIVGSGSPPVFLAVMAALMALHAMAGAASIVLIPALFPAPVRTSGLSIAYALGVSLFGGTAQLVFTAVIQATGSKASWIWYVVAMGAVSVLATAAVRIRAEPSSGTGRPGTA